MTINQIMDIVFPDTPDCDRHLKRANIQTTLRRLMMHDEVHICGETENLVGKKQKIYKVNESSSL